MAEERTFDAAAHMRKIRTRQGMQDYLDVKWRLMWLRSEHPDASVITEEMNTSDQFARFKATITFDVDGHAVVINGHGSETAGDFGDFYEKAETKAIGRACAVAGYGTDAASDFDDGVPMDGAGAAKGEPDRKLDERERATVETQHQRNTTPPPMTLPATRTRPEPNGPEVQRQKIREAAAAKDIVLPEDGTSAEWADALDRLFEILDSDFRVDRMANGDVTARALQSAILAVPAKVTA